jgi:hypothetical protein
MRQRLGIDGSGTPGMDWEGRFRTEKEMEGKAGPGGGRKRRGRPVMESEGKGGERRFRTGNEMAG